ncbi:conserved phage C-terminal domain-containing protein [Clostridioides sp. ZZV14-6044]|uniref:conserved phage C-terminal domain-containing protein n=1 Tax=unclassified Clostridioides TaxID=2635829 RepID=UPI001D12410E|nr:conserved phage C-terminal domain-containing protein [Clostridioides sp. ZZV14-6104]
MELLKDSRKRDWFWIENSLIDNLELSTYEKMIYIVLVRHLDDESTCFPRRSTIAKEAGCSEATVKRTINSLEEKKLIKRVFRKDEITGKNTSNLYYVASSKIGVHTEPRLTQNPIGAHTEPRGGSDRPANNTHINNTQLTNNIYSPTEQKKEKITNNDDSINTDSVSIPERFGINTDIDSVSIPEPNRYQYRNKDYFINDYSINDINTYSPLNKKGRAYGDLPVGHSETHPRACGDLPVGHVVTSNKTNINKTNLTNNIYSSVEQKEEKTKDKEIYKRVIDYLNKTADKSFKSTTKKTISLIDARLKEGFTEEEFYKVIDNKVLNWLDDDKMNAYLRPETLFGNKFESYLNETPKKALKGNESVKGNRRVNNKFANFDQTFNKYSKDEFDAIVKKSQKAKFK